MNKKYIYLKTEISFFAVSAGPYSRIHPPFPTTSISMQNWTAREKQTGD